MKIIDIHVYYGKWYFPIPDKSLDDILTIMDSRRIEKAIAMSSISILQDFREGNAKLFNDISKYERIYGYCYINGNYLKESLAEMAAYLPLAQCRGVKYHPEYSNKRPDDKDVLPLFESLAFDYQKPALIHSWPYGEHGNPTPKSHPTFIKNLADKIPELKLVAGHMGGPEWQEAIEIVKSSPNIYLDTGSSYTHYDKVKSAVDELGAERVLFGSGMTEGNIDAQLGVVFDSKISDGEKNTVLYEAAAKLFDLS